MTLSGGGSLSGDPETSELYRSAYHKDTVMKKISLTTFPVVLTLALLCGTALSQEKVKEKRRTETFTGTTHSRWGNNQPGTWDAIVKDNEINIQFYGEDWSDGRNFNVSDFGTLPTEKVGEFTLTREAGKVSFKGVFQDHWGHGTYKFEENAGFKSWLAQKGYTGLNDELMFNVFTSDINKAYFDIMKANGYSSIGNEQFRDLAEEGMSGKVMADYFNLFKTAGYGHQTLGKIIELEEHGVGADYIRELHRAGYKGFSLDRALELCDHGVSADYIAEIKKLGYPNLTLEKAEELVDHGVSAEYIESLHKMGFNGVTVDRAEELIDHGVSAEFFNGMHQLGYKNLTLEYAQSLVDHGVDPGFVRDIQELGFKDLSLEKAEQLADHGVNAAFIKKARSKGMELHTLDDYIRLSDTGFND
jgi:hypothetical protein